MTEVPPHGRPHVQINCAVSADGRLAYAGGRRARLSGPADLRRVQQLRASSDAILVGVGTVLLDDPSLRVHWELLEAAPGPAPLRVVLDSRGRTPDSARVLDERQPTLLVTSQACQRTFPRHVNVFVAGKDQVDLPTLLSELARRGVRRLLVEGGAGVIASFLRGPFVDRMTVFVAPVAIGGSTAPPMMSGRETAKAEEAVGLTLARVERCDDGLLITWEPAKGPAGQPGATAHVLQ